MKKVLLFILLFYSLSGFAGNRFIIRGTIEGVTSGEIYLLSDLNAKDTLASASILKGKFYLKGTSHSRQVANFRIKGVVNGPVIFLENTTYSAHLKVVSAYAPDNSGNFMEVKELENELHTTVTGGKDQKIANVFWEMLSAASLEYEKLSKQYTEAEHQGNEQLLNELENKAESLQHHTLLTATNLLSQYNNSYVSAYIIQEYISDLCEDKPEEITKLYTLLSEEARNSGYGRQADTEKHVLEKNAVLPSFTLSTPEGAALSLNDIKGKIKILEFWSKNCSPCLQEIPKLLKLYEKYKPLGLEIVAISLDNDKQTAEKLKAKHHLTWIQAGNYKAGGTDVEKLYNIHTIPYKIILTEDNRILAKGLFSIREIQKILDTTLTNK